MTKRNWEKHNQERDRLMEMVPRMMPEDVWEVINQEFLDDEQFIFYDRKKRYAYCTRCKTTLDQRFLTTNWSAHNEPAVCPHCGKKATFKCLGKYRKPDMITTEFQFRAIQRTPEGIVVRRYQVIRVILKNIRYWVENELDVIWNVSELQRTFNDGSNVKRYKRNWSVYTGEENWSESKMESFAQRQSMGYIRNIPEYEYRRNIPEVIADTWLKYAGPDRQIGEYAAWIKPIEYLVKSGMTNLAQDIFAYNTAGLKTSAKTVEGFLNIPKAFVPTARKLNLDIADLAALRIIGREGFKSVTQEDINFVWRLGHIFKSIHNLGEIRLNDWMRYIQKQDTNSSTWWAQGQMHWDYLKFCKRLGYDMRDRSVLYPSDLKAAHDREMVRVKITENKALSEKIRERFVSDKRRFSASIDGLIIRPPMDMAELLAEGSALQHCVGTYAEQVAKKLTTILLIRMVDKPEEPYFTMEWRDERVAQCRGKRNCGTTKEVDAFIETWQQTKKLKPKADKAIRRINA